MRTLFTSQIAAPFRQALRRFLGDKKDGIAGVAAIEFSIVAPPLILMMVCVADLGMGYYRRLQVHSAAQSGAEYAIIHGYQPQGIMSAVANATTFAGIAATPSPTKTCGCPSSSGIAAATCGTTCSDGTAAGSYVTVTATATYATLLPYPILPSSYNFVSISTVRVE